MLVKRYEANTLWLSDVEQGWWSMAHVFMANTLKLALMNDNSCNEELEAFSKLSVDELGDVSKILAFWFFHQHNSIQKEEVQNVLTTIYEFSLEDIREMQNEFSNPDHIFIVLHGLLSSAISKDINYKTFMPHILNSFKEVSNRLSKI